MYENHLFNHRMKAESRRPEQSRFPVMSRWACVMIMVIFLAGCASSNRPDILFERHDTAEGATYVSLPPSLARKYVSSEMKQNDELKEVLDEIKTFKALVIEKEAAIIDIEAEIAGPLRTYARQQKMQDLIRLSQSGNEIMVKARDEEGMVQELLISINNQKTFAGVYLEGNITLENVLKVLKNLDYNQLDSFLEVHKN